MAIHLAVAEDNSFLLHALDNKLSRFSDLSVDITASNGEALLKALEKDANIDLILMDIQMPGMDGIAATEIVRQRYPQIKVLMLTVFDDDDKIMRSILAGASGYMLKEESGETMYNAITEILDGGAGMSPRIALKVLNLIRNPMLPSEAPIDFGLTARELEILEHLKNGLTYQKVADNLFISAGTVRKHIENIYRKLEAHNKVEAIQKAVKHRLL